MHARDEAYPVALTSTIHQFDIDLADADRHVYESLALRVPRHPSESEDYMVTRVLAYALEYTEGIAFSRGLSEPDEPTLSVRDATGVLRAWIDIGTPDADRLHKASKAAARVAVYMHKDPGQYLARLASARSHRPDTVEFRSIDRTLLADLVARLNRRVAFSLSVMDQELYVAIGDVTLSGVVTRHGLKERLEGAAPSPAAGNRTSG